jgi:cell division protein FtsI (penicillin-binding protein 3)
MATRRSDGPPRSETDPPRRTGEPTRKEPARRRTGTDEPRSSARREAPARRTASGKEGESTIAAARRFSPRGQTVRENPSLRSRDPFAPALQLVDGGRRAPRRPAGDEQPPAAPPVRIRKAPGGRVEARPTPDRTVRTRASGADRPAKPVDRRGAGSSVRDRRGAGSGRLAGSGPAGDQPPPNPHAERLRARWTAPSRDADIRDLISPPRLADPRRRLQVSTALILSVLLAVAGRVVTLQINEGAAYAARGLSHRLQPMILPAPRGSILDRAGAVLAHSVEARYIYADPGLIDDPVVTADQLFPVLSQLGITRSELIKKMSKTMLDDGTEIRFVYLARGVDIDIGDRVDALNILGVRSARDEKREVPGHDVAANLIGFTGSDLTGLAGLEASYDPVLRGVEGERMYEVGGGDLSTEIAGGYSQERPAQPGRSIQLTIDRDLQYETQHLLFDRMQQAAADWGAAVVLDVRTGEVLAQASYPGYDAGNPLASQPQQRIDAATGIMVDPGSVHKAVVFAGALQEGVITPDSLIQWQSSITKGDQVYTDTHPLPPGTKLTPAGVLAYSSNIGTIKIADRLGATKLVEYQRALGLGSSTNEGLPGESAGIVLNADQWSGSGYGSIPIGLSVSVTPLQMAAVYAAIANNGVYIQPHLIAATIGPDGQRTPAPPPVTRRVISDQHAAELRHLLQAVVTAPGATGRKAAIANYLIAGKTGTGQQVANGYYIPGEVASFVGMAPADHPRYVVAVFAHSPGGNGGDVSAPAFHDIMSFVLGRYAVPPSTEPVATFTLTR